MSRFSITLAELFRAHMLDVQLPNILVGVTASIEVPLVTIVGRDVKADHAQIANFVLLSAVCRTALDIPFGVLVEFVGVRNVMLSCLVMSVAAALLGTRVAGFLTLGVYSAMSGISLGGFFLSRHIFVAGISSKKYRGMLMSFLSGLLRWSHVLGPLLTGLITSTTGDARNAFYIAAVTSSLAFVCLVAALCSTAAKKQCAHSCATSLATSLAQTPVPTDADEHDGTVPWEGLPAAAAGEQQQQHRALVPPLVSLVPPHSRAGGAATSIRSGASVEAGRDGSGPHSQLPAKVHPSLGPTDEHFFRPSALWFTVVDYWSIIWRLGIYIIAFGALRSNRKLLIMFAGMRENMSDAQVSYLLSFSFIFDALLFPLGGIIMDCMGRQLAMAPVAIGLGICFLFLPFCHTPTQLYVASSAFGIADAMGCGLIMTLTADRAPKVYGAPFFGIMRTLADMGHVVGAGGVSFLIRRVGHDSTCLVLAAVGLFTALWGVLAVPRDTEPLETPRLSEAVAKHHRYRQAHAQALTVPNGWGTEERPLLSSGVPTPQQRPTHPTHSYGAA